MTGAEWVQSLLKPGATTPIGQHLALAVYELAKKSGEPVQTSIRDLERLTGWTSTTIREHLPEIEDFVRVRWGGDRGCVFVSLIGVEHEPRPVYDAPIQSLREVITHSGLSLEMGGFISTVLLAILEWGQPLPADSTKAAIRVGAGRRQYERLLREGVEAGLLTILSTGEVTSPLRPEFIPRRKTQPRAARAPIPKETRDAVLAKTNGKCVYCAVELTFVYGEATSYHVDHVLPVTKGGSDDVANLVPCCASCNAKKSAKTALQFLGCEEDAT